MLGSTDCCWSQQRHWLLTLVSQKRTDVAYKDLSENFKLTYRHAMAEMVHRSS